MKIKLTLNSRYKCETDELKNAKAKQRGKFLYYIFLRGAEFALGWSISLVFFKNNEKTQTVALERVTRLRAFSKTIH